MENARVGRILDEIADLLELTEGDEFRIRSYRDAARAVRDLPDRLEDLVADGKDLTKIPHIGESTAEKIHEILDRGTCQRLEDLREEVPKGLPNLMHLPHVGPRKAMALHRELGVEDVEDLEKAAEEHRIRDVRGFGKKTESKIRESIAALEDSQERSLYREAAAHATAFGRHLESLDSVRRFTLAGSLRRRKETVGDLDVLVDADDRGAAADDIAAFEDIDEVESRGRERMTIILRSGFQIDVRFFDESHFGSALLYFTGSKAHNIALRRRAQDRDWKLNEYGLQKGDELLAGRTEEAVYHRLGLAWVPPELREDRGEIAAAEEDALPDLIESSDLRGDLHAHTDATDGDATIEDMAKAARERGYAYLALTDHSKRVTMAGGLDGERTRRHAEQIRDVDERIDDLWVMAGIEVDVLRDGTLDLDQEVLDDLDWVVASVHYDLGLGKRRNTDRLLAAIRSGVVDAIGHPLGRMIGQRDPIALDVDSIFEACREHAVCLEVNGQPERLDLPDRLCQHAKDAGVTFILSSDAHKPSDFAFVDFAVDVARRGWLTASNVLNTRPAEELKSLRSRR